jgi:hypothetical protein
MSLPVYLCAAVCVCQLLGVGLAGDTGLQHLMNVHFSSPSLASATQHRPAMLYFVYNKVQQPKHMSMSAGSGLNCMSFAHSSFGCLAWKGCGVCAGGAPLRVGGVRVPAALLPTRADTTGSTPYRPSSRSALSLCRGMCGALCWYAVVSAVWHSPTILLFQGLSSTPPLITYTHLHCRVLRACLYAGLRRGVVSCAAAPCPGCGAVGRGRALHPALDHALPGRTQVHPHTTRTNTRKRGIHRL